MKKTYSFVHYLPYKDVFPGQDGDRSVYHAILVFV